MTLRDPRGPDQQLLDVFRWAVVGAMLGIVLLIAAAVHSWGSGASLVELLVAGLLAAFVAYVGRRILRD